MDGIRFTCLEGCTRCCDTKGYVYLTESDLKRAAAYLGMDVAAFEAKYVYRTRHLLRLRKPKGSQCHFLTPSGCSIHTAKPTQCRAFPFWPDIVGSRKGLREAARRCPGIGQGEFVPIETVLRIAGGMREAYPGMYE